MARHECNAIRVDTSLARFLRTLEYTVNVEFLNPSNGNFKLSTKSLPPTGTQPNVEVTILVDNDPNSLMQPEQAQRIILPYQAGLNVITKICEPTIPSTSSGHTACTESHGGAVSIMQDTAL